MPKLLENKKRQFLYEAEDEAIQDTKEQFKVNFDFAILDTKITSTDERFTQMKQITSIFGFLYYINTLDENPTKYILDECIKLEKILILNASRDTGCF